MGYEIPGLRVGIFPADVDMSVTATWQYTAVWLGDAANVQGAGKGAGAALQAKGAKTTPPIGVLQNAPVVGEPGELILNGITKARAGGTFAVGDLLSVNSSGLFILAATGGIIVGQALESAVSGDICAVLLKTSTISP